MYVGSGLACSVQNSAMPAPDSVVAESRARVGAMDAFVQTAFGAMLRAVARRPSDLDDLGLLSQVGGFNPPAPYGSGDTGLPPGVSPNNGGAGADQQPQAPYVNDPWPVGLPAVACSVTPMVGGRPAVAEFAPPLTAASYTMPAATAAPAARRGGGPDVPKPAALPYRASSPLASNLAEQYKQANSAYAAYQAKAQAAIKAADPSGTGKVEVVYPGQAPGAPRYAAGYGSAPGVQPAVYVNGRLVVPSETLPAPGLPFAQAQGLRGLGCDGCGGGGFMVSFVGSLAASAALIAAWPYIVKAVKRGE